MSRWRTLAFAGAIVCYHAVGAAGQTPLPCTSFAISPANSTVPETEDLVELEVTKSPPPCTGSVDYATQDGSAKSGSDYQSTKGTLNFFATTASQPVGVAIVDDERLESAESFSVVLTWDGGSTAATVVIEDDDEPEVSPPPSPSVKPSPSPPPSPSPSPTRSPSPKPKPTRTPTPSPTPAGIAQGGDEGGGLPAPIIVAIVSSMVAVGSGAGLWWLKRTTPV